MRPNRRFTLATAFAVVAAVAALSAATMVLDFPWTNPSQEHSQWCWAGSSQALLSYYGTTVSQCEIANYASGYPERAGRPDCCVPSSYSENNNVLSGCNYWNYLWGSSVWGVANGSLQGILSHWGVTSSLVMSSVAAAEVVGEIDAGRPMIMRFGWKSNGTLDGTGHFLDIYGYEEDATYLDYWNPMPGWGSTRSLYTWVVDASDHSWTHTLKMTTNPSSTVPVFTDDPLTRRVTAVKAVHITELRQAINLLRARYGLPAFAWTDAVLSAGAARIKRQHLVELRSALADVFAAAGRSQPSYTNPTITSGVTAVTAAHIAEIRAAIKGIW
jgi:hypothetical protein